MKKEKITFDNYFEQIYGERWESLKSSLLKNSSQVIRTTKYHDTHKANLTEFDLSSYTLYTKDQYEMINQKVGGIKGHYVMDLASIICALSLDIKPDDFVLDMCAAPGGKSLILFEKLKNGELWANEISANRRNKLKSVIQEYIPLDERQRIYIKGKDGNRYGLAHPETFDKILIDAPCSGEKHLLHSPRELEKWTLKRTKRLSANQYSLLCSAILACKSGGQMVYSTCSISPLENDEVIKKALTKKKDFICLDLPKLDIPFIERTEFGYQMLPDNQGYGPIYFSRLSKK